MGFNFGAFAAGFGEGAAKTIESRNTEIRKGALSELDRLVGEAEKKEKGYRTERNELTQMAAQLAEFRGSNNAGFTETQILGLLQQPETAKTILTELKTKKNLEEVDFAKIFKPEEGGTAMKPQDYIAKKTSVVKQEAGPTPIVRTAFGLESPALRQAEASFEATTGRKVADVRGLAKGSVDLGEDFKPTAGTLDLSQFANPETIANITGRLRDARANKEDLNSPKNKKLSDQLVANAAIESQFKDKGEGDKPRTANQINSVIQNSLRVGLLGYELGNKVRYDPDTGNPIYTGDPAGVNAYNEDKRQIVAGRLTEMGYIKDGKVSKERGAQDAIIPWAAIDKDGTIKWRDPLIGSKDKKDETPPPAGPKAGAPSSVTAPVVSEKPIPVPKAAIVNGKLDGSKLIPGQTYLNSKGEAKLWNGTNWQ